MLAWPFVLIFVYKRILQYTLEDPVAGSAASNMRLWGSAVAIALFTITGMFLFMKIFLLLRFGCLLLALGSLTAFAGPFLSYYIGARIMLRAEPSPESVLTCQVTQGLSVGLLNLIFPSWLAVLCIPVVIVAIVYFLLPHPWEGRLSWNEALAVGLTSLSLTIGIYGALGMIAYIAGYTPDQCMMIFS
jgi:hypothetical protein